MIRSGPGKLLASAIAASLMLDLLMQLNEIRQLDRLQAEYRSFSEDVRARMEQRDRAAREQFNMLERRLPGR